MLDKPIFYKGKKNMSVIKNLETKQNKLCEKYCYCRDIERPKTYMIGGGWRRVIVSLIIFQK